MLSSVSIDFSARALVPQLCVRTAYGLSGRHNAMR